MERHGIISGKGLLPYLGLTLGIGAVALAVIRVGYMAGAALGCLPILLYIILFAIKKPYWAYTWLFIYKGDNETYIEGPIGNDGIILYNSQMRDRLQTRRTKRNV